MNSDERTDAALLIAASHVGDENAFAVLVRRYVRSATLLATQLLGDQDDAEDVVQDAFTIVYRRAGDFDPARPFGPWFYAIVRRLAAKRLARARRRLQLLRLWGKAGEAAAVQSELVDTVGAGITSVEVQHAIGGLSPMQRACFELVVTRDIPTKEVAAMHGIAESTVRQHVFRARAALRSVLEDRMERLNP